MNLTKLDKLLSNLATSKASLPWITDKSIINVGYDIKVLNHGIYNPEFIHKHELFQLIYVYSGACSQIINNQNSKLIKGDIIILSPKVSHSFRVFNNSIVLNIFIYKNTFNDLFDKILKENNVLSNFFLMALYANKCEDYLLFHTNENNNLKVIILQMLSEQLNNKKYSSKIVCDMLLIFLQYLVQDHENNYETSSIITKDNKNISEVLVYIQQNYASITLNTLADEFHFSNSYLSKHLKECTGYNFSQIIRYIKLRKSCDLLKSTNMNIFQISSAVGYCSEEHFIRTFKKEFNMSPTQYRRSF